VTMPKRLTRRVQEQSRSVSFRSSQAVDAAEAETAAAGMWSTTTASVKRPALGVEQAPTHVVNVVAACMFVEEGVCLAQCLSSGDPPRAAPASRDGSHDPACRQAARRQDDQSEAREPSPSPEAGAEEAAARERRVGLYGTSSYGPGRRIYREEAEGMG